MRTVIRDAHSEVRFLTWYFFTLKYNVSDLGQKKKALVDFYEYVRGLETELERDEFLTTAAVALQIDVQILRKDFDAPVTGNKTTGAWMQPGAAIEQKPPPIKQKPVSKQEKQIIALVIKFPELLEADMLLGEILWESDSAYLLFSFFHDRIKSGEVFPRENLSSAHSQMPPEMRNLLSEIDFKDLEAIDLEKEISFEKAKSALQLAVTILQERGISEELASVLAEVTQREKLGLDLGELEVKHALLLEARKKWQNARKNIQ